jgi:beta-lactamase regulating signal transducer with metallopeptidase domain
VSTGWSPFNWPAPPANAIRSNLLVASPVVAPVPAIAVPTERVPRAPSMRSANETPWLAIGWFAGAMALAAVRWGSARRMFRAWRRLARPTEPQVLALVSTEARTAGFSKDPAVRTSAAVPAPAISGLFRPTIWLPAGFSAQLGDMDLRFVIRHELAHWRRHDLWMQALLELARILHWWNPLVWLAVRAARADCETACDEFVMRRTSSAETTAYGTALLKVLGVVRVRTGAPAVLGVFENHQQLKRRILMISNYRAPSRGRTLVGMAAVVALALAALTRELQAKPTKSATSVDVTTTAPDGWWKNGSAPASYVTGVDRTVGNPKPPSAYVKSIQPVSEGFGGMMQTCDATAYRGKRVRLSASLKTHDAIGGAYLWLRVDGGEGDKMLAFDNMQDRPVAGTRDWTPCAVVLDVPAEAKTLNFGFFIEKTGQAWVSGLAFEEVGSEVPTTSRIGTQALPPKPVNLEFAASAGN